MPVTVAPAESVIRAEISHHGPISFARFMQLALYAPDCGYYRSGAQRVGMAGDFYTAEQLQPVFGETMAEYVRSILPSSQASEDPARQFSICELGAGRRDLEAALAPWGYTGFDWDRGQLPERCYGLLIANEFFDALPVRMLKRQADGWRELLVGWRDTFFFTPAPEQPDETALRYAEQYGNVIPVGGLLEMNVALRDWIVRLAHVLERGRLLVIDYGYVADELPRIPAGTVISYEKHSAMNEVLSNAGGRDITAHVNFSELRRIAVECGLAVEFESSMRDWLLSIWTEQKLAERWAAADRSWRLQWKKLVFEMGTVFRVIVLRTSR